MLKLSWPIAAAMLGDTAMGLVDTKLVGVLGPSALAGVGLATVLMYTNYSVVFGLMRGVKVRVAYALGQDRPQDAARYAHAGVLLGFLCGALVWVLARDATWALEALRVDPSLVPYARDFLAARTVAAPASCVLSAMVQYRQGLGDSRTPMRVSLAGNVLNALLAWALIHGALGLPALGVRGAGYATALVETLNASVLLLRLHRESAQGPRSKLGLLAALKEVCGLGVPTGLQFGVETLAFTAFTAVLGGMGAVQMAANQVALSILRVSFLPGIAVSEAASVLVGKALGRRRLPEADAVTASALRVAITFMCACGVVFALVGEHIAASFTTDREVVAVVRRLLLAAAVFQLGDAVNIVLRGALRGARDVRAVMVIGVVVVWVTLPGAAWLFGKHYGLGALGAWLGFIAETALASALLAWRWLRGSWREEYPSPREQSAPNGIQALPAL